MKKRLLLLSALALGTTFSSLAQTQRINLFEEWTGENCGPCAATNPGITALADANYSGPKKLILLRYQVAIPSAPSNPNSLYQQNPTEPTNRHDYYYPTLSDQFAPQGRMNGHELGRGATDGSNGHAGYLAQDSIDLEYQVDAPFALTTGFTFNSTYDSITITTDITAAQNFSTANPLKLQLAIIEEHIHYATAPGSNGEKDFEFIMRKMIPDENGQTLGTTWTNGQTQTLTNTVALPTYIWNKGEVAIVAFIQEDVPNPGPSVTRNVHQAAYGMPQPLGLDASTTAITGLSASTCDPNFTPTATISNNGVANLTSCTINYKIDNGTVMTQAWTGNLSTGQTDVVALPQQTATAGTHTFTVYTSDPNASTDNNANNDLKSQTFSVFAAPTVAPIAEPFSNAGIPAGYTVGNPDGGYTWTRVTTAGGTLKYDAWNNGNSGDIDHFYTPRLDFTGMTSMQLTFDVAYRPYSTSYYEKLQVMVSTDCGATWSSVYSKQSTTLATGAALTSGVYSPTTTAPSGADWRHETVSLATYDNNADVLVDFKVTNGYGNDLYIDNINIASNAVGIKEMTAMEGVNLYPNPANNSATLKFNNIESGNADVVIYNALGQVVYSSSQSVNSSNNTINLNTESFANGIYSVTVICNGSKTVQKLSINH